MNTVSLDLMASRPELEFPAPNHARALLPRAQCPKPLQGCLVKLLEAAPETVIVWNDRNRILYVNSAGRSMLGIGQSTSVVARSLSEFYSRRAYRRLVEEAMPVCLSRGVWQGQGTLLDQCCSEIPVSQAVTAQPFAESDACGEIVFSSIAWDMRESKQTERQLRHQATHDALTGLPNRALLLDRLTQALRVADRNGSSAAVLFMDLDDFKGLNDRFGHEHANQVLSDIARRLRSRVRATDTVARYGGDEFVLLVCGLKAPTDLERIGALLRQTFSEPVVINRKCVRVRASIGVAVYPGDGDDALSLLHKADVMMYRVKAARKRRFGASGSTGAWAAK